MVERVRNVLFLCTGNSARSIMAEAILDHWSNGLFKGYSAGSHPKGTVHPDAILLLGQLGMRTRDLRSKSWDEFAGDNAPQMDFIFTVCDNAAGEACPAWPGQPITAHWGFADPAQVQGNHDKQHKAFMTAQMQIANRIRLVLSLPIDKIDRMSLQAKLRTLGQQQET